MVMVRPDLDRDYPRFRVAGLIQGWESEWFYVCNEVDGPIPEFTLQARRKIFRGSTSLSGPSTIGSKLGAATLAPRVHALRDACNTLGV